MKNPQDKGERKLQDPSGAAAGLEIRQLKLEKERRTRLQEGVFSNNMGVVTYLLI